MNSQVDCRDRTSEFFSTIQQIQKTQNHLSQHSSSNLNDATSHRPLPKSAFSSASSHSSSNGSYHNEFDDRPEGQSLLQNGAPPKQQSQFTQAAQHIGRSIHMVTEKLEKLGKLARQRNLFNDPTTEINELTYVIKTDLSTLHNELEVLHKWVVSHRDDAYRSSNLNEDGTQLSVHAARNSTAIVDNLKQQLMTTTKSFQEVLQARTTSLKEQNQQRKQFEAPSSSSSTLSSTGNASVRKRGGNPFDALMNQAASHKHAMLMGETEATTEDAVFTMPLDGNLQEQLMATPVQADDYLTSRAEAVESIESTIVELGEMYKRLVHIVGMQEEITLRIDANMDSALENMDRGHHQLLTYYDSISGSRWLILKVFGVLLAFLVFFMLFVASRPGSVQA